MTKQLTAQEWFDKTVTHLRSMPGQAVDEVGGCQYLTADGNKCAIGIHIPDGHPGQGYMGGVLPPIYKYPDLVEIVLPKTQSDKRSRDLAQEMQGIHYRRDSWGEGGGRFRNEAALSSVAAEYGLTLNP